MEPEPPFGRQILYPEPLGKPLERCRGANFVTPKYVLLLCHMVISHHGEADHGSPKPPMFAEAEMLHLLDDMDAKMNEMEGVLRRTPVGAFSEKIWTLDNRRIYKAEK